MGQGQKTSPEIQRAIVQLSRMLNHEQISAGLDVSTSTIRRVLAHFNQHGKIPSTEEEPEEEKQSNRHLRDVDVEVRSMYFVDV